MQDEVLIVMDLRRRRLGSSTSTRIFLKRYNVHDWRALRQVLPNDQKTGFVLADSNAFSLSLSSVEPRIVCQGMGYLNLDDDRRLSSDPQDPIDSITFTGSFLMLIGIIMDG